MIPNWLDLHIMLSKTGVCFNHHLVLGVLEFCLQHFVLGSSGNSFFLVFTPMFGEDFQFDEYFQMGWFNHQLVSLWWFHGQSFLDYPPRMLVRGSQTQRFSNWTLVFSWVQQLGSPFFAISPAISRRKHRVLNSEIWCENFHPFGGFTLGFQSRS